MFPTPFAALSCDESLRAVPRPVVRPPPGLSLPEEELSAIVSPAAWKVGAIHPPPGLYEPLNLRAAWQGGLVCESDCSTIDAASLSSEPPSPATSHSTEGLKAEATAEAAEAPAGGYVPGRILQESIAEGQQAAIPLHLEDAVARTTGSATCPSVGSAGHWLGLCKPCDFFHRDRCTNAAACKFCHLCDSEEGKRRKKQKQALVKVAKRRQEANVALFAPGMTQA